MSNRPFFQIQPSRSKPGGVFLRLAAAVLVLALAGAACSVNTGSNPSGSPTTTKAGLLKDLAVHLEGLSSYRAALHLEFDGSKDGAPLAWSQDLLLESDRTDSARLLTIDRRGPDSGQDAAGILIGQFGSMSLTRPAADGACRAETGDKPLAIPEPAGLLRPVQQPLTYSGSPEEICTASVKITRKRVQSSWSVWRM